MSADDYIILQSDDISYKMQIGNISLDRTNINFYNEIVQLNTLTSDLSDSIDSQSTRISTLSSDNDNILVELAGIKNLTIQQKSDLDAKLVDNTAKLAALAAGNLVVRNLVETLDSRIDVLSGAIDVKLAHLDGRVALLEGKFADDTITPS